MMIENIIYHYTRRLIMHNELNTRLMNIERVHTDLYTKIDRVSADFNQFSLNSQQEMKSMHDTLHFVHEIVSKVLNFFTLLLFNM